MLPFLSLLWIFLSVILLYFNAKKYRSSLYLGLFFLFTSLYGLYQYIILYSKSVTLISLFLFNLSITGAPVYLIGPMLFFYIRSVLTDHAKLSKQDLWHFLPMLIYFIAALPNTFVPWQEKMETARRVVSDGSYIMEYKATMLSSIVPSMYMYIVRLVLVLGYTLWSVGMFVRYLQKNKWHMVFSNQRFMKKWLCCLIGFVLVLSVSQILLVVKSFEMHFSDLFFTLNIMRIISVTVLTGLLISPFFFPTILYGMPRVPETANNPKKVVVEQQPHEKPAANRNSFEAEYLNSLERKINACMKENQPYLQPNFNLAYLSSMIQVPIHHLAYFFREVKNEHFIDYRNKWRIEYAKEMIKQGKTSELTLEAIGLNSGFSNRNAFRSAFKKFEGNLPADFTSQINE